MFSISVASKPSRTFATWLLWIDILFITRYSEKRLLPNLVKICCSEKLHNLGWVDPLHLHSAAVHEEQEDLQGAAVHVPDEHGAGGPGHHGHQHGGLGGEHHAVNLELRALALDRVVGELPGLEKLGLPRTRLRKCIFGASVLLGNLRSFQTSVSSSH